jgi:hypothetical protein
MERRDHGEKGASLILVAAAMMLLIGAAALAVDLGVLRADIRSDRLAADAASLAGVGQINPFSSPDAVAACEAAWDYALLNLGDEGAVGSAPDCGAAFSGPCSPGDIRQEPGTAGPYTITISQPVPDGHALMGTQALDPDIDGSPCQRLGVTIERSRPHTFARVLGFDSNTTTVNSVARSTTRPGEDEIVPLLLLEPLDCAAMYTSGDGKITVTYNDTTKTPGIIVVDSNASTCGPSNPYSIDAKGTINGWIRAIPVPGEDIPSAILSYALSDGSLASFDPGDLDDDPDVLDNDRLFPIPTPAFDRITRKPLDWRYDCRSGYPLYPLVASNPSGPGIQIPDCPFSKPPHISNHRATYDSGVPVGFQSWIAEGYSCSPNGATISVAGNWHIDCPPSGPNDIGLTVVGGSVTIDGNVLMDGGLDLRNDGRFTVNPSNSSDVFVYVRDGLIIKRSFATLILNRTFVYLGDGAVDIRAGSSDPCDAPIPVGICWSAPEGGDFEDLALWSEANLAHQIGGQGGNNLTGTLFTPNAEPFSLDGQGAQLQFRAQFVTRRLEVKGTAVVEMTPDPERTTPIPVRAVDLIR